MHYTRAVNLKNWITSENAAGRYPCRWEMKQHFGWTWGQFQGAWRYMQRNLLEPNDLTLGKTWDGWAYQEHGYWHGAYRFEFTDILGSITDEGTAAQYAAGKMRMALGHIDAAERCMATVSSKFAGVAPTLALPQLAVQQSGQMIEAALKSMP